MPLRPLIAACLPLALVACVAPQGGGENVSDAAPGEASGAGSVAIFPLLDQAAGPGDNVWFSPLSADYAFSIVALGARGETADQLSAILPPLRSAEDYRRNDDGVEVRLATRLWVDDEFSIAPTFADLAQRRYDAGAERIDKYAPAASAAKINRWADENTKGLIPEVISDGEITPDLALIVTNAIYFDGAWKHAFDGAQEKPFLHGDGRDRPFLLMQERMELAQIDSGPWRAVRLPYRDERFVMDVVMPGDRAVMKAAPDLATIADLSARLGEAKPRLVDMELPRFEVDTDFDLVQPLKALGLTLPFDPDRADLSGIGASGSRNLYVGAAKQLAKLQVFDTGTKAAAVTVVVIRVTSAPPPDTRRAVPFVVDRPFIVVLRDLETDNVLFMGRIANPKAYTPQEGEMP